MPGACSPSPLRGSVEPYFRRSVAVAALAGGAALVVEPRPARADEPHNATEPRVMMEPGEVVNVIDAFDDGAPFYGKTWSLNIGLGFDYKNKSANILRETTIAQPGLTTGGFTTHLLNVANYSETQSRLTPRIDLAIYHDIALHVALPIILSNARSLSPMGSSALPANSPAIAGVAGDGGVPLFTVPFQSPTRSGLENITAGLDFDILDQARDRTKPTWLIGFEGRFAVGTPMHACNANPAPGQLHCADPSDINRDGMMDNPNDGTYPDQDRGAGVTRGTMAVEVHTLMSRRVKYVEPYGGFSALFEFPESSSDYNLTNVTQSLVNHPPLVGTMLVGMMIIPWENREKFGRLTFDLRFMAQYHSEGRDYSELFDAIGSSSASSLRQPNWSGYMAGPSTATPSVIDPGSQKVYNTGLTDVLAYGSYRGSASIMWQASTYVKFQFGLGYAHDQAHVITGDSPCNPSSGLQGTSLIDASGPCHSTTGTPNTSNFVYTATGVPNPNYRSVIDDPGRRYWVDGSNTFDIFASAVLMF